MSALARPLLALLVVAAAAAAAADIDIDDHTVLVEPRVVRDITMRSIRNPCAEIVINGPPGRGWVWDGIAPAQDAENLVISYDYLYKGHEVYHNITNHCNVIGDAQILAVEKIRVCNENPLGNGAPVLLGTRLSPVLAACDIGQKHCGPLHFYIEQRCFRDAPPK